MSAQPHGHSHGLDNPDVAHETHDVNVRAILWFVAVLTGVTIGIQGAMWDMLRGLQCYDRKNEPYVTPLTLPAGQPFPEPRLQETPHADLGRFRAEQHEYLHSYVWVDEKLGIVVDREWTDRENRRLARRIKDAKLSTRASLDNVLSDPERGIEKATIRQFATCGWTKAKQNVVLVGKTGVGKSYLASALADAACRQGYRALFYRASRLLDELELARDVGVDRDEHEAAIGAIRLALGQGLTVRTAAPDQAVAAVDRQRALGARLGRERVARVGAPHVRAERALEPVRIGMVVVELVAARLARVIALRCFDERRAARPASDHPCGELVALVRVG